MNTYLMTFGDISGLDPGRHGPVSRWFNLTDDQRKDLDELAEELERHSIIMAFQLSEGSPAGTETPSGFTDAIQLLESVAETELNQGITVDEDEWRELAEMFEPHGTLLVKAVAEEFGPDQEDE